MREAASTEVVRRRSEYPLVCPRCGHELKIVAAITDPAVIDRILEHRKRRQITSPFEPRAPPAA